MPNLIEVQKASYDQLLVQEPVGGRPERGCRPCSNRCSRSPTPNTSMLEFVKAEFEPPKMDECRQRHDLRGSAQGHAAADRVRYR
jgi:hypothetical protein